MKVSVVIFFVILSSLRLANAQLFSTSIIFEDALGNLDTLEVGHDTAATEGIDTAFGEENIIQQPWDSVFDVRISDGDGDFFPATFHTERQITPSTCLLPFPPFPWYIISFHINARHWPVMISWNNDFQDQCVDKSFITDFAKGGWFDVPCADGILNYLSSPLRVVTLQKYPWGVGGGCNYLEGNDTIQFIHIALSNRGFYIGMASTAQSELIAYPLPFTDVLHLDIPSEAEQLKIFNIHGSIVYETVFPENKIELGYMQSGMYFLEVRQGNHFKTLKIIKSSNHPIR